jgi:hypothetical protein
MIPERNPPVGICFPDVVVGSIVGVERKIAGLRSDGPALQETIAKLSGNGMEQIMRRIPVDRLQPAGAIINSIIKLFIQADGKIPGKSCSCAVVVIPLLIDIGVRHSGQDYRSGAYRGVQTQSVGKTEFRDQIGLDTLRAVKKSFIIDVIIVG